MPKRFFLIDDQGKSAEGINSFVGSIDLPSEALDKIQFIAFPGEFNFRQWIGEGDETIPQKL